MRARAFRRFAIGTLVYNLAVVSWGAYVRASGSGAGCGDHWPLCNGQVIPRSGALQTLVEFTHRFTSGLDGLLALVLLIWAYRLFPRGHRARTGAVLFMISMVLEAAFGAVLVKLGLVTTDASGLRAVGISVHQVLTFYLYAAIALTALWSDDALGAPRVRGSGWAGGLLIAAGVALPLLAITGAIAALGDTLFPAHSLAAGLAQDGSAAAPLLLRLRVIHPFFAVATSALVVAAAAVAARREGPVRDAAYTVGILLVLQLGAGLLNLALLAPTWMQLVHLLGADLVWLAVVRLAALTLAAPPGEKLEPAPA